MEWIKKLLIDENKCYLCQKEPVEKFHLCHICRMQMHFVDGKREVEDTDIYFPLLYTGVTKKLLEQYKFADRSFLGTILAEILSEFLLEKNLKGTLVIVPSTKRKIRHRGFDHMDVIAKEVEQRTGLKYLPHALEKVRDTENQHALSSEKRLHNLDGAFQVASLKAEEVLVLDDIVTSKNTMKEVIRAIKKAQSLSVTGVAVCSTSLKDM